MECIKCGVRGEMSPLHDVITGEGIVKLCKRCIAEENAPVIHKPTEEEIQSSTKSRSLYRRLSNAAGIDPEEHKRNLQDFKVKDMMKKQDVSLRDLVDKKFDRFVKKDSNKKRDDLVDNFHWIVMRARRARKISTSQLAKEMQEPERAIKLAEQGTVPEGYVFIRKLEETLGIRILKPEIAEELERQKRQLGFDNHSTKNLTISDLQEMKEKKEGLEILKKQSKLEADELMEEVEKEEKEEWKKESDKNLVGDEIEFE